MGTVPLRVIRDRRGRPLISVATSSRLSRLVEAFRAADDDRRARIDKVLASMGFTISARA